MGMLLETINIEKYDFIRWDISEKWVVLMRSDDPLAKKNAVTAKDLSILPLMLPRRLPQQAFWRGNAVSLLAWL